MPEFDTCYYWSGEACLQDDCTHEGENGECLADDEDLLTWEDYKQMEKSKEMAKAIRHSTPTSEAS